MSELKDWMLRPPRLTLAVAESMTSGGLQLRIGRISGASQFFLGGITAYSLEQKVRHLGLDRGAAAAVNCVSGPVAEQMARGVCGLFGAEVGIATTGYAEADPAGKIETPFAWWAIARRRPDSSFIVSSARVDCSGATRAIAQDQVADAAFAALLTWVKSERGADQID